MEKVTQIESRKSDHIRINLEEDVESRLTTGLEKFQFIHRALPEINLADVDLTLTVFGRKLRAPLLISSMTGGTLEAAELNERLAEAAEASGIAMGVGSQRAAIENSQLVPTFQVRQHAPSALLFANLGAVQLNYQYGIAECQKAVDMLEADGLILHFNALQEAVQPEGDSNFAGLAQKIETICKLLPVPVIAKEVGWGFSEEDIRLLHLTGVAAIDVAGAGGTSWSQVEMHRAQTESQRRLAAAFINWGIPTSQAIQYVRMEAPELLIFASGGLRSGLDIAKCLALGATLGGMAGPFLKAAAVSSEKVSETIAEICQEIRVCMFASGAVDIHTLQNTPMRQL
jgi:isopentenyl-diphosphate Delta-isomerase